SPGRTQPAGAGHARRPLPAQGARRARGFPAERGARRRARPARDDAASRAGLRRNGSRPRGASPSGGPAPGERRCRPGVAGPRRRGAALPPVRRPETRVARAAVAALAAAALGCGSSVSPAEIPERLAALGRPNLVLIVVDTLRADFTSPYGQEQ